MYRKVLLLLYLGMASSAPQDKLGHTEPEQIPTVRESSVENLPTTIPGDGRKTIRQINEGLPPAPFEENSEAPTNVDSYEDTKTTATDYDAETGNDDITRTTLSQDYDSFKSSFKPGFDNYKSSVQPELDIFKSTIEVISTTPNIEIAKSTGKPDVATPKSVTRPSFSSFKRTAKPKFYSKLSYFQKKDNTGVVSNLVESRNWRRKFRSNCRCEKISNCPKLQISVPRCPEEQFMCCF